MKLLVLSDVHANPAALEAVLAAEPKFDGVLFLGDAVDYGPDPSTCLDRLFSLDPVAVRGNHDNAVAFGVDCLCSEAFQELSRASRLHTRAALKPEQLQALGRLPTERTFRAGGATFYLTHATPRDNLFEYVTPEVDPERWAEAVTFGEAETAEVTLLGHTHKPYLRQLGRRTVVNPGSVGQPRDGDPRASYATWVDGRFSLKRVEYDVASTAGQLGRTGLPEEVVTALARVLRTGGNP